MSRYHSYINSAKEILRLYGGEEPFSSFLKKYFSANKKFGSKDRKQVAHLCYCFFRLGKAVMNTSIEEKILTALFLCSDKPNEVLAALKPGWDEKCELPLNEKLLIINSTLVVSEIFPWKTELSKGMDHANFCKSFLIQPDLFLRLRPDKGDFVKQKLNRAGIQFAMLSNSCIALPNASKVDEIIDLDAEAVIQDYSSQRTGYFIKTEISDHKSEVSVWDCCAGSGGKSIMIYDMDPKVELTVSDKRESILANLKKRFERAGIVNYNTLITDLAISDFQLLTNNFQLIVADVPCTGSGTWSRTPEQLYYFNEKKIEEYAELQKKIVSNVIHNLQPGGALIYITCSVFVKENEEVVTYIKENFQLELKQMEILTGYDKKADSMFVAVLSLPKH